MVELEAGVGRGLVAVSDTRKHRPVIQSLNPEVAHRILGSKKKAYLLFFLPQWAVILSLKWQ